MQWHSAAEAGLWLELFILKLQLAYICMYVYALAYRHLFGAVRGSNGGASIDFRSTLVSYISSQCNLPPFPQKLSLEFGIMGYRIE